MVGIGLWWVIGIAVFTVLIGMFLKLIIANWLTEREASIASFSFSLAGIPGALILDFSLDYVSITDKIGSILGLAILWWMLFKREKT